ncbi:MAG: hypothetical protein ACT4OJ_01490 [Bacteroidota bacterium]
MIKTAAFVIIIALRLIYQPTGAQQLTAPFASPQPPSTANCSKLPATIIGISSIRINNTILLKWIVGQHQNAWCFEAEKNTAYKHFTSTTLVSGTGKSETDQYPFYEKAGNRGISYSINRQIRDKKVAGTPVVAITPTI